MRDPKRIPEVLAELQKIWEKLPDLRLGQLIGNLGDAYYLEDDKLLQKLEDLYG